MANYNFYFQDGSSHIADSGSSGHWPQAKCPRPDAAGVTLNDRGFIAVDEYQNTVVPSIYVPWAM